MQKDELVITREDQAKAVQDVGFLGQFVNPSSPSYVAKKLGMAANLAHHHAQKHANLGLLLESERSGGKVYYQLAARAFKHRRGLLSTDNLEATFGLNLFLLKERFLAAFERSDRLETTDDPDWSIYKFASEGEVVEPSKLSREQMLEAHPAHFQARTVRLSQVQYLEVVRRIRSILEGTEATKNSTDKDTCTLAFLAFDGDLHEHAKEAHVVSSFVPPLDPNKQ